MAVSLAKLACKLKALTSPPALWLLRIIFRSLRGGERGKDTKSDLAQLVMFVGQHRICGQACHYFVF